MLAVFRNNHATTLFILALYIALLRMPAILGWVPFPGGLLETDGSLLFRDLFGRIAANPRNSAMGAAILVFIQAFTLNFLADRNRLLDQRNWYPGALYALAVSCIPEFLFISPALIALTFLPFALLQIFGIYKQILIVGSIFDSAFWITIAALFHPPAAWCIPAGYLALLSLRRISTRKQIVFLSGVFVPVFLALTAYFWFDQAGLFLQIQLKRWISLPGFHINADFYFMLKTALLGFLVLVTLFGYNVYYFRRILQVQKYITILYWFLFAALAASVFHREVRLEYFLLTTPTVGIFLAFLGQSIRNSGLTDFLHLVLLAGVFYVQLYPIIP